MIKRPDETILTNNYYNEEHFVVAYKRLLMSTHWIDPITGERVKLTHNFKAVYHHRLEQYKSFTSKDQPYKEGHRTVSDKLGIDYDMIRRDYTALMKRMGLMVANGKGKGKTTYIMYELKFLNGYLMNEKLDKHQPKKTYTKKVKGEVKEDGYQLFKASEHNKKQMERIRGFEERVFIVSESEHHEYFKWKREQEGKQ